MLAIPVARTLLRAITESGSELVGQAGNFTGLSEKSLMSVWAKDLVS